MHVNLFKPQSTIRMFNLRGAFVDVMWFSSSHQAAQHEYAPLSLSDSDTD